MALRKGGMLRTVLCTGAEPDWAKNTREKIEVIRTEFGQSLAFEFVGSGGWDTTKAADYIGWRETGIGLGDVDALLSIEQKEDGTVEFVVFGYNLIVRFDGVEVAPMDGPYIWVKR